MKRYSTTIDNAGQLKTAIDNARAAGIFKDGDTLKDFESNVATYIAYCETFGVRVSPLARPGPRTLWSWYLEACSETQYQDLVKVYGPTVVRDMHVVEYLWPDGGGSWEQCTQGALWTVVTHYERMGCQVSVDGRSV